MTHPHNNNNNNHVLVVSHNSFPVAACMSHEDHEQKTRRSGRRAEKHRENSSTSSWQWVVERHSLYDRAIYEFVYLILKKRGVSHLGGDAARPLSLYQPHLASQSIQLSCKQPYMVMIFTRVSARV